jgi:AraC-like DNA-binding protein
VEYRELAISNPESPLTCVWELRGSSTEEQRIVPDGHAEIVVHLAEPFEEFRAGEWRQQQPTILCGQITRPLLIRASGETHTVGLRLRSWATGAIFRDVAAAITDQVVDGIVTESDTLELARTALAAEGKADLNAAVERLLPWVQESRHTAQKVRAAVWLANKYAGQCSVEQLAQTAGVTVRHLDRVMLENVGVAPKMFLRLIRFRNVMAQASSPFPRWADIAASCGYHDQSHMLRDFAQFVGRTPSQAFASSSDLAKYFFSSEKEL